MTVPPSVEAFVQRVLHELEMDESQIDQEWGPGADLEWDAFSLQVEWYHVKKGHELVGPCTQFVRT